MGPKTTLGRLAFALAARRRWSLAKHCEASLIRSRSKKCSVPLVAEALCPARAVAQVSRRAGARVSRQVATQLSPWHQVPLGSRPCPAPEHPSPREANLCREGSGGGGSAFAA